ncbi:MAG: hypothetical protein JWN03_1172 [Nocardia sp.]|nr:hypothetical protein [Nocardia sp.]
MVTTLSAAAHSVDWSLIGRAVLNLGAALLGAIL